eukprot:CAMPEP_0181340646 /NCGR_PEP_ID=MMETSP1101-20121128/29963_1 /TAXON_ID=46948 /ORGANISM="Rhodomonas abbreviata, Strain Caron Lab Isolate" /LENGTH=62 /DNA_ID=CAMNT_0023451821 /DNA_START=221 /DNA_END=409 /DNA_ORIENTATION=+
MTTFLPDLISGAMSLCQKGRTLSNVIARLSVLILAASGMLAYLGSLAGYIEVVVSHSGGGTS